MESSRNFGYNGSMLEDVTRTQAPEGDGGTRTFGVAGGTASFSPGPAAAEPVTLPAIPGFEVLELVGRGGMGLVFRARQLATGRVVALKMIVTGELANTAARDRFRSEITATAKLSHPHIVQLFEAGEADGRAFLVCEFVGGGSLAARLDGTPWDAARAARMIVPIARAVASAHASGIVHRDLKPANILLDTAFAPKLADFGIAKQIGDAADAATHTGAILGTPSYMAPEQAGGAKSAGPAADVYGLGAILYELITGRPPFKGADFVETLDQVRRQEPVAPRILQPKLPRDIETICLKCLQKDPAKRYASAKALAEDLERFLERKPIAARPVSGVERAWRWTKRNPAVSGLMAAAFLILVAGTAVSVFFALRADAERRTADDERNTANDERNKADARAAEANAARLALGIEGEKLRKEQEYTRRLLYISRMSAASEAFNEGRIPRLVEILEQIRPNTDEPDDRGWEWHYLDRITRPEAPAVALAKNGELGYQPVSTAHNYAADEALLSADGTRLARLVIGKDPSKVCIAVWEVATGRRIGTFPPEGPTLAFDVEEEDLRFALSPNGSHVALLGPDPWTRPPVAGPIQVVQFAPKRTLRIWEVATGRQLPVPALDIPQPVMGRLTLGPDGAWAEWSENPPPVPPMLGFGTPFRLFRWGGQESPSELEPLLHPWYFQSRFDRGKGVLERTRLGFGASYLAASVEGLAVFASKDYIGPAFAGPGAPGPVTFSLWNTAASPPVLLSELGRFGTLNNERELQVMISPGGKIVGVYSSGTLTVIPVPKSKSETPQRIYATVSTEGHAPLLRAVSDEGVCVFSRPNSLIAVDPLRGSDPVVQLRSVQHHRDGGLRFVAFAPGGRELLTLGGDGPLLRRWDVTRSSGFTPHKMAPPGAYPTTQEALSSDGTLRVRWKSRPFQKIESESLPIEDAKSGEQRGAIAITGETWVSEVRFVAGDRRILVRTGGFGGLFAKPAWSLHELDGRRIADAVQTPTQMPYLDLPGDRWIVAGLGGTAITIHDAFTGKLSGTIAYAKGDGAMTLRFDSSGDRFLVVSGPADWMRPNPFSGPPAGPPAPTSNAQFKVQLHETATGRPLWKEPVVLPEPGFFQFGGFIGPLLETSFHPDGKRVIAGYPGLGHYRMWIGRAADGSTERVLDGPKSPGASLAYSRRGLWLNGDGTRVLIGGGSDAQVWNLDTGEAVAKLSGHEGFIGSATFTPDGTRVFTMDAPEFNPGRTVAQSRIHVWDLPTGRPVLTHRVPSELTRGAGFSPLDLSFKDGKLVVLGPAGRWEADGTPLK